jgi:hypothetical protein
LIAWDKGTVSTKPKELCPSPPRIGSRPGAEPAPQWATSSVKREAKGRPHTKFQGQVQAHHVAGDLTLEAH